jgi:hypothetical protein
MKSLKIRGSVKMIHMGDPISRVVGNGNGVLVSEVCVTNDVDGTEILPKGRYKVRVTEGWKDYETGGHAKGFLLEEKDIVEARKRATTGLKPTNRNFDPSRVYFFTSDIIKVL